MQAQGWKIVDHQSRGRRSKWTTGLLTDDTVHVVTWELDPKAYVQSQERGGSRWFQVRISTVARSEMILLRCDAARLDL
jgi:hypothetical protein